jgi:hypothetical protein
MGTAQQEIPVATINTVHTLQLTTEEVYTLARAMQQYNEPDYDQDGACLDSFPSREDVDLAQLLFSLVPLES